MEQFTYKTRGDVLPDNKPCIYFFSHPEDSGLYDDICQDLLRHADCAIYRDTAPCSSVAEELEEMQLFVIPVTAKLLNTYSRAMEQVLTFAKTKGIPVLPLMQEPGLINQFNRKSGGIQYVDRTGRNDDGLTYDEQLSRFLDAILVNPALHQRIEAEFQESIFLSYRKKDREAVKRLLSLIHTQPAYQDIPIWFDDFLTPGEQFTASIQQHLRESRLFLLAVTPSLLERNNVGKLNFVARIEYPAALQEHKPILPAELVKTNRAALEQILPKLPPFANLPQTKGQAVLDQLKTLLPRTPEKNPAPEHHYLVGLAYWNGIGMEVNRKIALNLVTAAAERGLQEAMEWLVDIFQRNGHVWEAISWQKKLVQKRQNVFRDSKRIEDGKALAEELLQLGDLYWAMRDRKKADTAYVRLQKLCESLPTSEIIRSWLTCAHVRLGRSGQEFGEQRVAREHYYAALQLAQKDKNVFMLSLCTEKLGRIHRTEGNADRALEHYQMAVELDEQIAQATNDPTSLLNLSISYDDVGNLHRDKREIPEARAAYEKALQIRQQVDERTKDDPRVKELLAISYNKLALVCQYEENEAGSREWATKCLEASNALVESAGLYSHRIIQAIALERMGDNANMKKDYTAARQWYQQSRSVIEALLQEKVTLQARRLLVFSCRKLGYLSEAEGLREQAIEWHQKAEQISGKILAETKDAEMWNERTGCLYNMGRLYTQLQKLPEAKRCFERCVELFRANPNAPVARKMLPEVTHNLQVVTDNLASGSQTPITVINQATLEQDAENGQAAAQWALALKLEHQGKLEQAMVWLKKAAAQGEHHALLELGQRYQLGEGVPKDPKEGERLQRLAAEKGNEVAQYNLGVSYTLPGHIDYKKAVYWLEKSAAQGEPDALSSLGLRYKQGQGVPKDMAKAIQLLRQSAEKGCASGQYNLGLAYMQGEGVARNPAKAFELYKKAAEQKNSPAMVNLGWCYDVGFGTSRQPQKAFQWYSKAAQAGEAHGQYCLAGCYLEGLGTQPDQQQAIYWLRQAAKQGHRDAKQTLLKLGLGY